MIFFPQKSFYLSALVIILLNTIVYAALFAETPPTEVSQNMAYKLKISGPITPSTSELLIEAIELAERNEARALIVEIDTPGGLVPSMDEMTRAILGSRVPVITYVSPKGATCGSACVYILYASHVAAMAPATNIGSATPVAVGNQPGRPGPDASDSDRIPETAGSDDLVNLKRKQINHAIAQVRALAEFRQRNVEFAEKSVSHAENITASQALNRGAIDLIADSVASLLEQSSGLSVRMNLGSLTLDLQNTRLEEHASDFRRNLLNFVSNPNIAMILMMLGMAGIFAEIYQPGAVFPGAIGSICLVLGMYAMHNLDASYAGIALIALGALFFMLEIKIMSYGLLSIGGTICMLIGSILLAGSGDAFMSASLAIFLGTALLTATIMASIAFVAAQSQGRPVVSGVEDMLGATAQSRTTITAETGEVLTHSEIWQARTFDDSEIPTDQPVRIEKVDGLILYVRKTKS